MAQQPICAVLGVGGVDITAGISAHLLSMTLTDNAGSNSDTLSLTVPDKRGSIALPSESAPLFPFFGYKGGALNAMGEFYVDDVTSVGGGGGQKLNITAKSIDTKKSQKQKDSKHWDDKTVGDVLKEECGREGLQLMIAPKYENIMREYTLRKNKSLWEFGTELAETYGAVFKIAGKKALFLEPQSGLSLGGMKLPVIPIIYGQNLKTWNVKPRLVRPAYGETRAEWYDTKKAKRMIEKVSGNGSGPVFNLQHIYQDQAEAKGAAEGKQSELDRSKGGGTFNIKGNPYAMAETPTFTIGTRSGVDGLWYCKTAVHSFQTGGYSTAITVEIPKSSKK